MAYEGEVTPDLMHTAGSEFQLQKGAGAVPNGSGGKNSVKGLGFLFPSPHVKIETDCSGRLAKRTGAHTNVLLNNLSDAVCLPVP